VSPLVVEWDARLLRPVAGEAGRLVVGLVEQGEALRAGRDAERGQVSLDRHAERGLATVARSAVEDEDAVVAAGGGHGIDHPFLEVPLEPS